MWPSCSNFAFRDLCPNLPTISSVWRFVSNFEQKCWLLLFALYISAIILYLALRGLLTYDFWAWLPVYLCMFGESCSSVPRFKQGRFFWTFWTDCRVPFIVLMHSLGHFIITCYLDYGSVALKRQTVKLPQTPDWTLFGGPIFDKFTGLLTNLAHLTKIENGLDFRLSKLDYIAW